MSDIVDLLRTRLGSGAVLAGSDAEARYRVDFSHENACTPLAVLRPTSTDEVAAILRECHRARQRVVIQGGLTGIEQLDRAAQTMTVRAGTPLQAVQQAAADAGYLFPLDLGARGSCTIGGYIATNAGGTQVIRFGMMRNLVLGLEAVLADGTVVSSMNKMLKNNAGYDLKHLFIGTEGTLGVVTRAVLRLWPKLPSKVTALCALRGLDETVRLLHSLQARLGGSLSAFEAMWAGYFHYVLEHMPALRSPFSERHAIYALVEIEGTDHAADAGRLEAALAESLDSGVVADAVLAQSAREAKDLWAIRDGIGEVTPTLQPMLAFDVSVTID